MAKLTSELEQIFKFRISDYKDIPAYMKRLSTIGHLDAVKIEKLLILILVKLGEIEYEKGMANFANATSTYDVVVDEPGQNIKVPELSGSTKPEFACPDCGKTFKAKIGLSGHSKTHKK